MSSRRFLIVFASILAAATAFTAVAQAKKIWNDGTYNGTAKGFKTPITVSVKVEKNAISEVKIVEQTEKYKGKEHLLEKAFKDIPAQIVKKQSTDGIDAVTGATFTSKGIVNAAKDALAKAEKK